MSSSPSLSSNRDPASFSLSKLTSLAEHFRAHRAFLRASLQPFPQASQGSPLEREKRKMGNFTCSLKSFPSILSFLSTASAEQVPSSPGELTWLGRRYRKEEGLESSGRSLQDTQRGSFRGCLRGPPLFSAGYGNYWDWSQDTDPMAPRCGGGGGL